MGERNVQQVVGQNPGLLVSVHEWRNTGRLQFLASSSSVSVLGSLGDSLFKQIFIINKSITLDRHRLSVQFTVFGHRLFGNVNNVLHPWLVERSSTFSNHVSRSRYPPTLKMSGSSPEANFAFSAAP